MARNLLDSKKSTSSPFLYQNLERAAQLRQSGFSFRQICAEIGGDPGGWSIALKKIGQSGEPDSRKKWSAAEQQNIVKLYRLGTTADDIGDRFGVSGKAISSLLSRLKVTRR